MSEATEDSLIPAVFEQLLQSLDLTGAFPGDRGPGPSQVTQLPDRLGRHERATDQTMGTQLSQPGRVRDVGLAAGQIPHMPSVDQQHLEPASSSR